MRRVVPPTRWIGLVNQHNDVGTNARIDIRLVIVKIYPRVNRDANMEVQAAYECAESFHRRFGLD